MNISDKELLRKTSSLVLKERTASEAVLLLLDEVFRRRLFADLGYSSLFNYLVKELKYSEAAAGRRVNLLKLSRKVPEVRKMVVTGEINLTVASMLQSFSKNLDSDRTKQLVSKLKNKTKDQAELELLRIFPKAKAPKEQRKRVTSTETRIHLSVKNTTLEKLELIKDLKKLDTNAALDYLIDLGLEEHQKSLTKINKSKGTKGRSVSAGTKKKLYLRANSCCEYKNCKEARNLEVEHLLPYSAGGGHELSNLKLYCRAHNQRAAIIFFGQQSMDKFL